MTTFFSEIVSRRVLAIFLIGMVLFASSSLAKQLSHLETAQDFFNKRNYTKAREACAKALESDPASSEVRYLLARIHLEQGDLGKATLSLVEAINLLPYQSADSRLPNSKVLVHFNRGKEYLTRQETGLAIKEFLKVIETDPSYAPAYYEMAFGYAGMNDFQKVFENIYRGVQFSPDCVERHRALGGLYLMLGNKDRALKEYEKALAINRDYTPVLRSIGILFLDAEKIDGAIALLQRAQEIEPGSYATLSGLGLAYTLRGEFTSGEKLLNDAIAVNEKYYEAYERLGFNYLLQERLDDAISSFKKAVALNHMAVKCYENLAAAYKLKGLDDKAIAQYQEAVKLNPESFDLHFELGTLYAELGKDEEAVSEFNRCLGIAPDAIIALYRLGLLYQRQGKYDMAVEQLKKTIKIKPDFTKAYFALGVVYDRFLDNPKEADYYYSLFAILEPDSNVVEVYEPEE